MILKHESLLRQVANYIQSASDNELGFKKSSGQWSKKEILGHLIDSAIYNIQRFTEIQFKPRPYHYNTYEQDALVEANQYRSSDAGDILRLWLGLNQQIIHLVKNQDDDTLAYRAVNPNGKTVTLKYLIEDYVVHMEHHVKQILT